MNQALITILVAVSSILVGGFAAWFFFGRKKEDQGTLALLQKELEGIRGSLDNKLDESMKWQFGESQKLAQDLYRQMGEQLQNVTKQVVEVGEASKQIFGVADQLQNLEKVLKHQKQRGNLGEASLELTLGNILPPDGYKMQYLFPDGDQVDAVIFTKDGMIPVDAKFSLDNYNRIVNESDEEKKNALEKEFKNDLKKRIDETAKYIKPKEGTLSFAFMFIPAEAIFYDLLVNEVGSVAVNTRSLIDYAYRDKNVIVVSPTTFSAYLSSVVHGFRAFKIEKSVKIIAKNVEQLKRHLKAYDEYFKKVGKSLGVTVSHYGSAQKEFGKIDKDVLRITGEGIGVESLSIDKPEQE